MRYAVTYVSTANPSLSEEDIKEILTTSKNKNNYNAITGILLYSQGNFFQVLEGEPELIKSLFLKIKEDERHYDVMTIFQKEVDKTKFDTYKVDFLSLDARVEQKEMSTYFNHLKLLNPQIQDSVRYILQNFTAGI